MVISAIKTVFFYRFHYICMMCVMFLFSSIVSANTKAVNEVSLQVVNSFSGGIALLNTDTYCLEDNIYITPNTNIPVNVRADKSSMYTVAGDDIAESFSGNGIGLYVDRWMLSLTAGDGLKSLQSTYISGNEYLASEITQIYLDTTSPSSALPLEPFLGSDENGSSINFERSTSNDVISSTIEYTLHVSNHPSFIGEKTYTTNTTFLNVNKDLLPTGTIYRYITSKDCAGNTIDGVSSFFTIQAPPPSNGGEILQPKTYHVDNISLKGYTSEIDVVCQGDIWGYVYAENPENISIDIQILGSGVSHTYSPQVSDQGYYALPIEYINVGDSHYIAPGNYTVNVHTSHPEIGDKNFTYENLLITDTCRETKVNNTSIGSDPLVKLENNNNLPLKTKEVDGEHNSPESYTKHIFDREKIRQQNTLIRLQQLQAKDAEKTLIINKQDPLNTLLQFPDILQRTGVDPRDIIGELYILEKLTTNKKNKKYLQQLIHLIQPGRYPGVILFLLFLCYDIQIYNKRMYLYIKNTRNIKKKKKIT